MGNYTLVELSHDETPREEALLDWARAIKLYLGSGDRKLLPHGVHFLRRRHSSEPCSIRQRPRISQEQIRVIEREIDHRRREIKGLGYEMPIVVAQIAALEGLANTLRLLQATDIHAAQDEPDPLRMMVDEIVGPPPRLNDYADDVKARLFDALRARLYPAERQT